MANIGACTVGYLNDGYAEQRNIIYATGYGVKYVAVRNRCDWLKKAWHRMTGISYSMALHCFAVPTGGSASVLHSFNSIVLQKGPWVVTFETTLPRTSQIPVSLVRLGWRRLSDSSCVRVLALSDCSRQRFLCDLERNRPRLDDAALSAIRSKIEVLHPPQAILVTKEEKKRFFDRTGPLRLTIVGHEFYRKGGLEILIAMDSLLSEGLDFRLSIVGGMAAGDYASRAGEKEVKHAEALIEKHADKIGVLGSLPGVEVLDILRQSHVLCLPTWGETYGYSVLEGQAAGCATVTSDLRALPEINNDSCGWIIAVPKLANGDGDVGTSEKRSIFREMLVDGLRSAFRQAHDDRELLTRKGMAALERVRQHHDPGAHAQFLKHIYSSAFTSRG